ncbi:FAD binding domain-containing protein [Podospora aff. communis PSN243]|uniref:FAD binding domain-containing protein n=1 Tax=Podospora aff. communis PSN243 TaxID=3040156 RepID=A0AAV9H8J1_9PEZI|nr:FAD binding domain-containing protein [Podospora aff. communis PSN243]
MAQGNSVTSDSECVETRFLIVGAGPAGASLACFLTTYGLGGIIISNNSGTADTPRAHLTNQGALECLRDIGLEEEAMRLAHTGECMSNIRWCSSMAGEEYARVYAFGKGPGLKGEYESASPCEHIDLPQTLLEPILIRHATHRGFGVRFQTKLLSFTETGPDGMIVATVLDMLNNREYKIRTKYLFGADGARSIVAKQLGLPMTVKAGGGSMVNILFKADLSHLMKARQGNLHWVMQPAREDEVPDFAVACIMRMIKPWDEWMCIAVPAIGFDPRKHTVTEEQYIARIREFIGDDTPIENVRVDPPWHVNEIYAEQYSKGNVFCLGDAVHRHPPHAGLGSNTCIQDAYNLAWKVAYVEQGLAGRSLLDTYSIERQPVGEGIVTRANDAFRDNGPTFEALGLFPPGNGRRAQEELRSPGAEGRARRLRLRNSLKWHMREFNGLGIELSQRYVSSAVYLGDEEGEFELEGRAAADPVLHYQPVTYPGRRLPHAWVDSPAPTAPKSTMDLVGHGAFGLLTGHGGDAWIEAAEKVGAALGVRIKASAIGFGLEWRDVYDIWADTRGVEESGAVLVRPDRVVAWRAQEVLPADQCVTKLQEVMRSILGIEVSNGTSRKLPLV